MSADLYGLKHSHAVLTSRMALEQAGVPFTAHDLFPGVHGAVVRARGSAAWTVPALRIDGARVQGTLAIARAIHERAPEAGLFGDGPQQRTTIEDAERFGHDVLQPVARRIFRWAGAHDNAVRAWMAREVLHLPAPTLMGYAFKPPMVIFGRVISKADDAQVRGDLLGLPAVMDRVDALVAAGAIGGAVPNAADLQILCSLRLLLAHADLRTSLEHRAGAQAALRLLPAFPRVGPDALAPVPAALPPAWLPG